MEQSTTALKEEVDNFIDEILDNDDCIIDDMGYSIAIDSIIKGMELALKYPNPIIQKYIQTINQYNYG